MPARAGNRSRATCRRTACPALQKMRSTQTVVCGTEFGLFHHQWWRKWVRIKSGLPTIAVRLGHSEAMKIWSLALSPWHYVIDDYAPRKLRRKAARRPALPDTRGLSLCAGIYRAAARPGPRTTRLTTAVRYTFYLLSQVGFEDQKQEPRCRKTPSERTRSRRFRREELRKEEEQERLPSADDRDPRALRCGR